MNALHTLLPALFLPLGVSLILLGWGLLRRRRIPIWAAFLILLISSNSFTGYLAIRTAEGWAVRRPLTEVVSADAVVVLSEGRGTAPGPDRASEWTDADRFFGGVALLAANKAPLLVFTGAATSAAPEAPREGEVLRSYAQSFGVAPELIRVTDLVLNTADEAREVRRVLGPELTAAPRIVLVTSAFHMPRAAQQFRAAGFVVDPYPVDFKTGPAYTFTWLRLLPSPGALAQTQAGVREQYGRLFYWLLSKF